MKGNYINTSCETNTIIFAKTISKPSDKYLCIFPVVIQSIAITQLGDPVFTETYSLIY